MEFNEKLQELRKRSGLTQEELAQALFVSRTAVSKWESGRGYPNIDSLKAISAYFQITVDELLSSSQLLTIAQEDHKEIQAHFVDLVFGLLDLSAALFLFLPIFGQRTDGLVVSVSLLSLSSISLFLKAAYFAAVTCLIACGAALLILKNCRHALWIRIKHMLSLFFSCAGILLFIVSPQPYAAAFLFVLLLIKVLLFHSKKR